MDPSAVRGETGETEAERFAREMLEIEVEAEKYLAVVNRPYVKSFTTSGGEIIDCVRIEDQLGFDPIKDAHILKQIPETKFEMVVKDDEPSEEGSPNFNGTGKRITRLPDEDCCPKGTVPIKRMTKEEIIQHFFS